MIESNVYKWEEIRKYFPPDRIAEFRADILKLRESGKDTDEKLWKKQNIHSDKQITCSSNSG